MQDQLQALPGTALLAGNDDLPRPAGRVHLARLHEQYDRRPGKAETVLPERRGLQLLLGPPVSKGCESRF
jgi:hypothetical protein